MFRCGAFGWRDPREQTQYEVGEPKWLGNCHSEAIPTFVLFPTLTPHLETWDTAQGCAAALGIPCHHRRPVLRVAREGSDFEAAFEVRKGFL